MADDKIILDGDRMMQMLLDRQRDIAALKEALNAKTCECRGWEAGMAAVNAENARLRAALEEIVELGPRAIKAYDAYRLAKDALGDKE